MNSPAEAQALLKSVAQEVLEKNRELLRAIDGGDWDAYAVLCDNSITCFEPEAPGQLIEGMPFHKFYFDLPRQSTVKQSTMSAPHVRLLGNAAIVSYTRVVQRVDSATGAPTSSCTQETRVWQRTESGWKHVHFHRSPQ